jgi:hypothetical protein
MASHNLIGNVAVAVDVTDGMMAEIENLMSINCQLINECLWKILFLLDIISFRMNKKQK